jgi:hypothetical protein
MKFKLGGTIRRRFLETVSIRVKQQILVSMKLYFNKVQFARHRMQI